MNKRLLLLALFACSSGITMHGMDKGKEEAAYYSDEKTDAQRQERLAFDAEQQAVSRQTAERLQMALNNEDEEESDYRPYSQASSSGASSSSITRNAASASSSSSSAVPAVASTHMDVATTPPAKSTVENYETRLKKVQDMLETGIQAYNSLDPETQERALNDLKNNLQATLDLLGVDSIPTLTFPTDKDGNLIQIPQTSLISIKFLTILLQNPFTFVTPENIHDLGFDHAVIAYTLAEQLKEIGTLQAIAIAKNIILWCHKTYKPKYPVLIPISNKAFGAVISAEAKLEASIEAAKKASETKKPTPVAGSSTKKATQQPAPANIPASSTNVVPPAAIPSSSESSKKRAKKKNASAKSPEQIAQEKEEAAQRALEQAQKAEIAALERTQKEAQKQLDQAQERARKFEAELQDARQKETEATQSAEQLRRAATAAAQRSEDLNKSSKAKPAQKSDAQKAARAAQQNATKAANALETAQKAIAGKTEKVVSAQKEVTKKQEILAQKTAALQEKQQKPVEQLPAAEVAAEQQEATPQQPAADQNEVIFTNAEENEIISVLDPNDAQNELLHRAARQNDAVAATTLVDQGANPEARSLIYNTTPLEVSARIGNLPTFLALTKNLAGPYVRALLQDVERRIRRVHPRILQALRLFTRVAPNRKQSQGAQEASEEEVITLSGTHNKTLQELFEKPQRADISWTSVRNLLEWLKERTNRFATLSIVEEGVRVKVKLAGKVVGFHIGHDGNLVKEAVKRFKKFFEKFGLTPDDHDVENLEDDPTDHDLDDLHEEE